MIFSYAPDDASHNEICGSSVDSDVADSDWFLTKEVSWGTCGRLPPLRLRSPGEFCDNVSSMKVPIWAVAQVTEYTPPKERG